MTKITTPFGFKSTAAEVLEGVDLSGKIAIVTGATSGIGVETARALAKAGAHVALTVRRTDAGQSVAEDIKRSADGASIEVLELDLADQASVRRFVTEWTKPLHILINNAGIMGLPELEKTSSGWEMQFATNFLGHFSLTIGLHRALAAANGARIASVSSNANTFAPVFFDDPHFDFIPYTPVMAYGQSKTACALLAVEANRRWSSDGIFTNALHPGAIPTNLQRHTGGIKTPPEKRKTTVQGAATSVLVAASPLLDGVGGRYFEDCNEADFVSKRPTDLSGGVAPYALNAENAERLWLLASKLIADAQ
jgi:NAD(P)-dependent dehydrogenase (short-subunit alcohol dehydrogenase family)